MTLILIISHVSAFILGSMLTSIVLIPEPTEEEKKLT
jgi:hypothetical protein